jgi:hypothetical protein
MEQSLIPKVRVLDVDQRLEGLFSHVLRMKNSVHSVHNNIHPFFRIFLLPDLRI